MSMDILPNLIIMLLFINTNIMINILRTIDITDMLSCYSKMESDIVWTSYDKNKQTGLQYKEGEDPWLSAVGRRHANGLNFTNINPFFKNSIFEEIINEFDLVRTRLMWVGPFSCYSMHSDDTPRLHIPLITHPDCYFIYKHEKPIHLKTGNIYNVETRVLHTFMNCSDISRLHLIGELKK
jgi:hypothetical protein